MSSENGTNIPLIDPIYCSSLPYKVSLDFHIWLSYITLSTSWVLDRQVEVVLNTAALYVIGFAMVNDEYS